MNCYDGKSTEFEERVSNAETKIQTSNYDDIVDLIVLFLKLAEHVKTLNFNYSHSPEDMVSIVKPQGLLLSRLNLIIIKTIKAFLPREEKRLLEIAECAIKDKDKKLFGETIRAIKYLDKSLGSEACSNFWLEWDDRPWHVYSLVETLKKKYNSV